MASKAICFPCGLMYVHVYIIAYVETVTNIKILYLKYIPKVLQDPLKSKESR